MEKNELRDLDGNRVSDRKTYNAPSQPGKVGTDRSQGKEDRTKTEQIENEKKDEGVSLT